MGNIQSVAEKTGCACARSRNDTDIKGMRKKNKLEKQRDRSRESMTKMMSKRQMSSSNYSKTSGTRNPRKRGRTVKNNLSHSMTKDGFVDLSQDAPNSRSPKVR